MWYRVTQMRSAIGLPKKIRETALALGLQKRGKTVYKKVCPRSAGQILAIKELVKVDLVDQPLTREEERKLRRKPKGYEVESTA